MGPDAVGDASFEAVEGFSIAIAAGEMALAETSALTMGTGDWGEGGSEMAPTPPISVRFVPGVATSSAISAVRSLICGFSPPMCRRRPRATRAAALKSLASRRRIRLRPFVAGKEDVVVTTADQVQVGSTGS